MVGGLRIIVFGLYIAGVLRVGLFGRSQQFFKRYRPFIPIVERAAGVLLIVVGALVVTNY